MKLPLYFYFFFLFPFSFFLSSFFSPPHLLRSHPPHLYLTFSIATHKPQTHLKSRVNNPIQCLFTGIVEEMGKIKQLGTTEHGGFDLKIDAKTILKGIHLGDNIAVNDTCFMVTQFDTQLSEFTVGLAPETLRKTSLSELSPGSLPTSQMSGTGEIVSMEPEGDSLWVKVKASKELLKYIVPKGLITVDGTSLTVVDVFNEEGCFNFMLVAYTQQKVVIALKKVG
ncbi:hypothetical protein UlMin_009724 [Ulmus minor]